MCCCFIGFLFLRDFLFIPLVEIAAGEPLEFGHTLEDQIGGQIDAGFAITGFFEDGQPGRKLAEFLPIFIATMATKPETGGTPDGR